MITAIGAYFTVKMWKEKNESNIEVRLDNHQNLRDGNLAL